MSWYPFDDDGDDTEEDKPEAVELTVEITEPGILGYLYGPRGEIVATMLDRPVVPFGFQASGRKWM